MLRPSDLHQPPSIPSADAPPLFLSPLSEGGFFNAVLSFPPDYPQSPPTCRFTSEMWHPNGKEALPLPNPSCLSCRALMSPVREPRA